MHPLFAILKPLALRAITHKLVKETNEVVFDKKKTGAMSSVYMVVITAGLTYLSSKGYIDPALYELVKTILTSPEVAEAVSEAI